MSIRTLNCLQPQCDEDGCNYVVVYDVELHFSDVSDAKEAWFDHEGWTDGETWICDNHIHRPHEFVVGETDGECDRCHLEAEEHGGASS